MKASCYKAMMALLIVLTPFTTTARAQSSDASSDEKSSSIAAVVDQVKKALADVQTELANNDFPKLKQVELTLQTTATKKTGATIKLWVINIGGTVEKDKMQQIDIVLTPPPPAESTKSFKSESTVSLSQELESAIFSVAEGVKNAGVGKIPLKCSSIKVQIGSLVSG
jgi:hypothetical protein